MRTVVPFVVFTLVVLAVKPGLLRVAFPVATCLVGYRLYRNNEAYFLSFLLWVYMLAPLLRRLVDWRTSFQSQSYILLAPLLITLLPCQDLGRRLGRVAPPIRLAVLLAFGGIFYGFGIGCITRPGPAILLEAASWIAPIVLCIFAASIREAEDLARVVTRTFLVGVLVMSVYGIYQFVVAPPWDTYWLKAVTTEILAPSFGHPRPYEIRVWSTMNAPGPFGAFLSVALPWLATSAKPRFIAVAAVGYIALLLTMDRAAWLQTTCALLVFFLGSRPKPSLKALLAPVLVLATIIGGLQVIPAAPAIEQRLQTLTSLKKDGSVVDREQTFRFMIPYLVRLPLGVGLDYTTDPGVQGYPLDSSLVVLFLALGWIGAGCYLAAFSVLAFHLLRSLGSASKYAAAAGAIVLACFTELLAGDVLHKQGGILLWLVAGIWASTYRLRQEKASRLTGRPMQMPALS